jgi:hypothetical protein
MSEPYVATWRGMRVPWITRWTEERLSEPYWFDPARRRLTYGDELPGERDSYGLLWQREGIMRGGEPEFSQVSTVRQRASMRHRRCQVCGLRIEGVIPWLLTDSIGVRMPDYEGLTTSSGPTCSTCVEVARELCPHVRLASSIAHVRAYRVVGASGEAAWIDSQGTMQRERFVNVDYERHREVLGRILAKQLSVEFTEYRMEGEQSWQLVK